MGCVLFWQRGSKLYQKTTQRISIWYHFHPILHQLGAKGALKINKKNNKLKTCKPKYKQNEKSQVFRMRRDFVKNGRAQRLHVYRCFMKKRCKTILDYI